jgi:signal recognition particle subunit SRP19
MVTKKENKLVIWPEYFDSNLTRASGRRIPKKLAFPAPKIESILKAAKSLGYKPVLEREKRYPKRWWRKDAGRILVSPKGVSKTKMLTNIAKRMKKLSTKND